MEISKPFLSEVAQYVKDIYEKNLEDICIILPNNRSVFYFKKALSEQIAPPFLSPDFFSIEDFVKQIANLDVVSHEELLILLYNIYSEEQAKADKDPFFHEFIGTAQLILRDFNEIDMSLADPQLVYETLFDIKSLSYFGKTEEQLTEFQKSYLVFFRQMYLFYTKLTKTLLEKQKAYPGLIYRQASQKIEDIFKQFSYKRYVFVGFNALQKSEEKIISYLIKMGMADFLVDADKWYVDDLGQEAGMFIRKIKEDFALEKLLFVGDNIAKIPKKIEILGFPNKILQAKYLPNILSQFSTQDSSKTAIVLADETLLLPVLYSMDVSEANITMSYPLKETMVYDLLKNYFTAIENSQKFRNRQNLAAPVYYKDLFLFFNNIYVKESLSIHNGNANAIIDDLVKKNKIFYTKEDLEILLCDLNAELKNLIVSFFSFDALSENVVCKTKPMLSFIKQSHLSKIDLQAFALIEDRLDDFDNVVKQLKTDNATSLRMLFESIVSSLKIPIKSDPFSSLQIMGMLETRTLDFDNVIILSLNEKILPAGKSMESFIPYDVKKYYGMPTYQNGEAIFSYHFYRLLQRAKNIYLLYSVDNQEMSVSEKSRFIRQITSEWKDFENISMEEKILSYPPVVVEKKVGTSILKTDEMLEKIMTLSFSPSLINQYLNCSLQFYYSYVLSIASQENISEEIQSNVIGTVIHKVLEDILKNKTNHTQNLEEKVMDVFCDPSVTNANFTKNDFLYEKNHLIFKITIRYIKMYLDFFEKERIAHPNWQIIASEKKMEQIFSLDLGDKKINIRLKGFADRIDNKDGITTVIDYKTGKVEQKELTVDSVEDLLSGDYPKAFQLALYAYLYYLEQKQTPLQAQIISFRNIKESLMLEIGESNLLTENIFADFTTILQEIFTQILDKNIPLTQTPDEKKCIWCDYRKICMRT